MSTNIIEIVDKYTNITNLHIAVASKTVRDSLAGGLLVVKQATMKTG